MDFRIAEANFIANLEQKMDERFDFWEQVNAHVDAFNEHHCIWKNDVLVTRDDMYEAFYGSQQYNDWRRSLDVAKDSDKPAIAREFEQIKHDFIQSEIETLCEFIVGERL